MENIFEVNFDGLVGPTHNYSGLSSDNLASNENEGLESNPKQAALQGLKKMKFRIVNQLRQIIYWQILILKKLVLNNVNQL